MTIDAIALRRRLDETSDRLFIERRYGTVQKSSLNVQPGVNWVEARGGLPPYIARIAVHLVEKGNTISHAIQTAINVVKKMCATGDLNWPGRQDVNPVSRAEACAAVAEWEALKAAS